MLQDGHDGLVLDLKMRQSPEPGCVDINGEKFPESMECYLTPSCQALTLQTYAELEHAVASHQVSGPCDHCQKLIDQLIEIRIRLKVKMLPVIHKIKENSHQKR